jgi:hypothetical protein
MTESEAIAIAQSVAEQNGWPWGLPAHITYRKAWFKRNGGRWEIFSNANGLGAKIRVVVDDKTGLVLEKGFVGR